MDQQLKNRIAQGGFSCRIKCMLRHRHFHQISALRLVGAAWFLAITVGAAAQDMEGRDFLYQRLASNFGGTRVILLDSRLSHEDDPRFADLEWDDTDWEQYPELRWNQMPARTGVYWVRFLVRLQNDYRSTEPPGVRLATVCAYEMYWDGQLVGYSGKVGASPEEEVPGPLDAIYTLPVDRMKAGEHVLAFRVSSYHDPFPGPTFGLAMNFGPQNRLASIRVWRGALPLLAACLAALVAVASGIFAAVRRNQEDLKLFALLSGAVALLEASQAVRWTVGYDYTQHYSQLLSIAILTTVVVVCMVYALQHRFATGGWWKIHLILLGIVLVSWLVPHHYQQKALTMVFGGLVTSAVIVARASKKDIPGLRSAEVGIGVALVVLFLFKNAFLERGVFIVFGVLLVALMVSFAQYIRVEQRARRAAVVTSARLQAEFAKRYLQPHFLLNTLTVLQEAVETSPVDASRMIDALAGEARLLGQMSDRRLVCLDEELSLCRMHLQVMEHRTGRSCHLEVNGEYDPCWNVPPAVLHTLVENAFTHKGRDMDVYHLTLDIRSDSSRLTLTFSAPGSVDAELSRPAHEGMGTRYIRARLEESFPGSWSFQAGLEEGGTWRTVIRFPISTEG